MAERMNLFGLTVPEIFEIIKDEGFEYRHAVAVAHVMYKKKATDLSLSPGIPKKLKTFLGEHADILIGKPVASQVSKDNTVKYLFRNTSGQQFETVYIPEGKRNTVCVSVQSGCRMGCPFCATAAYGFHGDLLAGDILSQVAALPIADKVNHIVFMGMGEPMDNLSAVLRAAEIFTAEWGMSISARNITVSTVGITDAVIRFLEESECNLTISLFSPFPEERLIYLPAERKYPVLEIIDILKSYKVKKKRRISMAYLMVKGKNDTDRHLDELIRLFSGTGIRVNLLPLHASATGSDLPSDPARIQHFKHILVNSGISASSRKSRGADISAACGLLASGLENDCR